MRGIQSDLIWYQSFRTYLSPGSSTNLISVGYLVHDNYNISFSMKCFSCTSVEENDHEGS